MKKGAAWRTLPSCFENIFSTLIESADKREISIDSTFVKVTQNDSVLFEKQISGIKFEKVKVLAGLFYCLREKGAEICISPKSNMKSVWDYDKELYKSRNKIKRFFII